WATEPDKRWATAFSTEPSARRSATDPRTLAERNRVDARIRLRVVRDPSEREGFEPASKARASDRRLRARVRSLQRFELQRQISQRAAQQPAVLLGLIVEFLLRNAQHDRGPDRARGVVRQRAAERGRPSHDIARVMREAEAGAVRELDQAGRHHEEIFPVISDLEQGLSSLQYLCLRDRSQAGDGLHARPAQERRLAESKDLVVVLQRGWHDARRGLAVAGQARGQLLP